MVSEYYNKSIDAITEKQRVRRWAKMFGFGNNLGALKGGINVIMFFCCCITCSSIAVGNMTKIQQWGQNYYLMWASDVLK